MRKVSLIGVLLLAVGLLSGCTVSSAEQEACEARGGSVVNERYPWKGGFFSTSSGDLHGCLESGLLVTVYELRDR